VIAEDASLNVACPVIIADLEHTDVLGEEFTRMRHLNLNKTIHLNLNKTIHWHNPARQHASEQTYERAPAGTTNSREGGKMIFKVVMEAASPSYEFMYERIAAKLMVSVLFSPCRPKEKGIKKQGASARQYLCQTIRKKLTTYSAAQNLFCTMQMGMLNVSASSR